jgi:hypothetical protein
MKQDRHTHTYRGFRISHEQSHRLNALADTLGISPNKTIGLMIDNAKIKQVSREEPVAVLEKLVKVK